jgi:hypothetical protein
LNDDCPSFWNTVMKAIFRWPEGYAVSSEIPSFGWLGYQFRNPFKLHNPRTTNNNIWKMYISLEFHPIGWPGYRFCNTILTPLSMRPRHKPLEGGDRHYINILVVFFRASIKNYYRIIETSEAGNEK